MILRADTRVCPYNQLSTLNYLDIIIAIILFLFGYKGFRKGLIIEVVTLLAFAVNS